MSSSPPPDREPESRASLKRDLGDLLIEISIGVHRYAMYPPGHPALTPVARDIVSRFARCFETRERLDIGVAQDQLVIGGVATDSKHPVLSDLARRLHDHELGAVSFRKGVRVGEIEELLEALSADTEHGSVAVGALAEDERPSWEHIVLHSIGYESLELRGDDSNAEAPTDRAMELWLGLARAAVRSEEPLDSDEELDEVTVAESIGRHGREKGYDQVIAGYLLQLGEELKQTGGGEDPRVRARVSGLIRELDDTTLERFLSLAGNEARRRDFVLDANQALAADAVMKVLRAAASSSEQSISDSMVRLLTKLSVHAEEGGDRMRDRADTALRENVERLLEGWELEDPNPDQYTLLLDRMAREAPLLSVGSGVDEDGEEDVRTAPGDAMAPTSVEEAPEEEKKGVGEEIEGPLRLVQTALEVEAWGPVVESAVTELLDRGRVGALFDLVDRAPDSAVTSRIVEFVTHPDQVRRLLQGEDVPEESLDAVLERMGSEAVGPLVDALAESGSRSVRRKVFDRLAGMEADLVAEIEARLEDSRWYVVRNMLALIQRLESPPDGIDVSRFLEHPDHRVRREAFPIVLGDEANRTRTLAVGLADEDERLVRMALVELQKDLPETLVPTLVNRVVRGERPQRVRAAAVRALRGSGSALARNALLEEVRAGKSLLGRPKLAKKSPVVLAALEVLGERWRDHEEVRPLLRAARASGDEELMAVAEVRGEGS